MLPLVLTVAGAIAYGRCSIVSTLVETLHVLLYGLPPLPRG